jgi:hypothetical protein
MNEIELESWVRRARAPESPVLGQPEPGIALAVSEAALADQHLRLRLHITVKLPGAVAFGYRRAGKAVIITVHDSHGEWLQSCSLLDPHKTFPGYEGHNYVGPSTFPDEGMLVTSYYGVDIRVPVVVAAGPDTSASVFVSAMVNRLGSDVVRITLTGAEPTIEPKPVRSEIPGADEADAEDEP